MGNSFEVSFEYLRLFMNIYIEVLFGDLAASAFAQPSDLSKFPTKMPIRHSRPARTLLRSVECAGGNEFEIEFRAPELAGVTSLSVVLRGAAVQVTLLQHLFWILGKNEQFGGAGLAVHCYCCTRSYRPQVSTSC